MKIYTIVVTFNGKKWVDKCFGSLLESSVFTEIIVVDNNSSDETLSLIHRKSSRIKIVKNSANLGFGVANNIGIALAMRDKADYVFLLNQDAWIEKNTIEKLANGMQENRSIGVLSPIHRNGNNTALDFNFKRYLVKYGNSAVRSYVNHDAPLSALFYSVGFINAAAWLVSRECIDFVGGFDPLFYHYGEDKDYLNRVNFHGFSVGILPDVFIYHDRENRSSPEILSYKEIVFKRYRSIKIDLKDPRRDFNEKWRLKCRSLKSELYRNILKGKKESIISFKLLILMLKEKAKIREHHMISAKKGDLF